MTQWWCNNDVTICNNEFVKIRNNSQYDNNNCRTLDSWLHFRGSWTSPAPRNSRSTFASSLQPLYLSQRWWGRGCSDGRRCGSHCDSRNSAAERDDPSHFFSPPIGQPTARTLNWKPASPPDSITGWMWWATKRTFLPFQDVSVIPANSTWWSKTLAAWITTGSMIVICAVMRSNV